jgi:hypothetical protein
MSEASGPTATSEGCTVGWVQRDGLPGRLANNGASAKWFVQGRYDAIGTLASVATQPTSARDWTRT